MRHIDLLNTEMLTKDICPIIQQIDKNGPTIIYNTPSTETKQRSCLYRSYIFVGREGGNKEKNKLTLYRSIYLIGSLKQSQDRIYTLILQTKHTDVK